MYILNINYIFVFMKCKIFGHKWNYYTDSIEYKYEPIPILSITGYTIDIITQFRICKRCSYKQERFAFTNKEKIDWRSANLNKEEMRNEKLKSLGI